MKRIIFYFAFIVTIVVGTGLFYSSCTETQKKNKVLTKEIKFTKEGEITLKKRVSDSILAELDLEIAETDYETQTGLMYRHSMNDKQAMLFIFKEEELRSFYMKNTEFALDIIFINSKKEIVSIKKNAKPFDKTSLSFNAPAMYVLEINAGLSDTWGLEIGDVLEWTVY